MSTDADTTNQRMTATGRRPARDVERTLRNIAGVIRAQGRRADRPDAGLNDLIDVPTLAAFADVAAAADEALRDAVHHLRRQDPPATWAEIGDTLGVTKQAAYQRFGRTTGPVDGARRLVAPPTFDCEHPDDGYQIACPICGALRTE